MSKDNPSWIENIWNWHMRMKNLTHMDEFLIFFVKSFFFVKNCRIFKYYFLNTKPYFSNIYIWLKSVEPTILVQYYMSMISMLTSTLLRVRNINFIASNIDIMDKSLAAQIHVFIQYLHLFEWRLLMAIFNLGKNWVLRFWLILKMGYVP